MNWIVKSLLVVFFVCFVVSLFLPGIIYKPAGTSGIDGKILYGYDVLTLDTINPIATMFSEGHAALQSIVSVLYGIPVKFLLLPMILWIAPGGLAWYANVLSVLAIINIKNKNWKYASLFSIPAAVIGLDAFLYREEFGTFQPDIPHVVDYLGSGYYVWEFSLLVLCLACLYQFYRAKRDKHSL